MAWKYSLNSDIVCQGTNVLALTWQDADYLIEIILLEKISHLHINSHLKRRARLIETYPD